MAYSEDIWLTQKLYGNTPSESVSLALDLNGHPHIAFDNDNFGSIMYAYFNGSDWEIERAYRAGYRNEGVSIAVDSNGNPHICFVEVSRSRSRLYYMSLNGGRWTWELINSKDNTNDFEPKYRIGPRSMVLDSGDRPEVVYVDIESENLITTLKHAARDNNALGGSVWKINQVDGWYYTLVAKGFVTPNQQPEITVTSDDKAHFIYSYFEASLVPGWKTGKLKYAWEEEPLIPEIVPYSNEVLKEHADCVTCPIDFLGTDYSISTDIDDNFHILIESRFEYFNYLFKDPNEISTSSISTSRGKSNSIAVDRSGILHVCYINDDNKLYYATSFNGITWFYEFVTDALHFSDTPTNIKIDDENDIVHVTYAKDNKALYYASRCSDFDEDNLCDYFDNCPKNRNPDQADADFDGYGDKCDFCPGTQHANNDDSDSDGFGDICDNCKFVQNIEQSDSDGDGIGDPCDNCLKKPNGPEKGTCTQGPEIGEKCGPNENLELKQSCYNDYNDCVNNNCNVNAPYGICSLCNATLDMCLNESDCGVDGFCSMKQEDCNFNGRGDACDEEECADSGLRFIGNVRLDQPLNFSRSLPTCSSDNVDCITKYSLTWEGSAEIQLTIKYLGNIYKLPTSKKPPIEYTIVGNIPKESSVELEVTALNMDYEKLPISLIVNSSNDNRNYCSVNDHDYDADGICSSFDNCPEIANNLQSDVDNDGFGDACDNCIYISNADQRDSDGDGIGNSCEVIKVSIDIKPDDCVNDLNVKARGVLPVIILGSEDFDVTQINPDSITLEGVSPERYSYEDVSNPNDCEETPDGYIDLTLKFKNQKIINELELGDIKSGDKISLILKANTNNEIASREIQGQDTVNIKK